MDSHQSTHPDKKHIINLYAAFAVSILLTFIPSLIFGVVALLFFTGVLITAYILRGKAEDGSLMQNHSDYMIRTIWISALYAFIFTGFGSAYMLPNIDYSPFDICAQNFAGIIDSSMTTMPSTQEMMDQIMPCMNDFMTINHSVFTLALAISAIPVIIFLFIRLYRGLSRANKGYRISNVKSWF